MTRKLITAPLALVAAATFIFAATSPAAAASADPRCTTMPDQARTVAATADASVARQALRYVTIAEKLCEAGNEREAGKKLQVAFRTLGVDEATQLAMLKN